MKSVECVMFMVGGVFAQMDELNARTREAETLRDEVMDLRKANVDLQQALDEAVASKRNMSHRDDSIDKSVAGTTQLLLKVAEEVETFQKRCVFICLQISD